MTAKDKLHRAVEDAAAADEAWEAYKRGEAVPLDQIRHEFD